MKGRSSYRLTALFFFGIIFCSSSFVETPERWGFFGHRQINRIAVFTLPLEILPFYKRHIDFIEEHAIDPDKRRYVSSIEGIRHYIDLDFWVEAEFKPGPGQLSGAIFQTGRICLLSPEKDTLESLEIIDDWFVHDSVTGEVSFIDTLRVHLYQLMDNNFLRIDPDLFTDTFFMPLNASGPVTILFENRFTDHGILPYHLVTAYRSLVNAFRSGDPDRILKLSAEIGHYLADAHVPLHTTQNYNGQLTGQLGIHAFWETRIPELFAREEYDFFVGPATYIEEKEPFFWDIVTTSHSMVELVLRKEKELKMRYPPDRQFCFDERGGNVRRLECREYARRYQKELKGMVEGQMRAAIRAVGSIWYSAWVDGGRPQLDLLSDQSNLHTIDQGIIDSLYDRREIKGRSHELEWKR